MRATGITAVTALLSLASAQNEATNYYDSASGIAYSSITHSNGVTYRIALPANSSESDAIVQIVSPQILGWCGLSWGGQMTFSPLSVAWSTGAKAGPKTIVSSRMAGGKYLMPAPYKGATHTYLKGTTANSTHWQVTARCQGCTRWSSPGGDFDLQDQTKVVFGYACSKVAPYHNRASNMSQFNIHEQHGIWSHDLTGSRNEEFEELVEKNLYEEEELLERGFYA